MVDYRTKKMIVSDMDGTLCASKSAPDYEIISLIEQLLIRYDFAVISGSSLEVLTENLSSKLKLNNPSIKKFYLVPTSGASMFLTERGEHHKIYEELLSDSDIAYITKCLEIAIERLHFHIPHFYGATIESRKTAITYSALGQAAPIDTKKLWDPDQSKRTSLLKILRPLLPDFHVVIGGMTSVDITKKGINKAYGIQKLSEHSQVALGDMLYIGDQLYPGGSDAIIHTIGVDCYPVRSPEDTKDIFLELLK